MLVAENLTREFPAPSEPLVVLRGISLTLHPGQQLAVIGPSGCGKSTLLQILGTLDRPTAGTFTLDDQQPFTLAEPQLADFRNRQIGFVFQDHHLLPQCTVLENVLIPTLASGGASPAHIERARYLLGKVGLEQRLDHRPGELSGGERQRAAIARALLLKPKLLLADEPTGNLDRASATKAAELLIELQQQEQAMLVVVTHSAELAARLARRVTLVDGRLEEVP